LYFSALSVISIIDIVVIGVLRSSGVSEWCIRLLSSKTSAYTLLFNAENRAPGLIYINDGTRDIGSVPNNILLVRNLDPLSSEEAIYHAFSEVTSSGTAAPLRVLLVRDRHTQISWGFAFVEFATSQVG
jgi:hypothetical protein